MSYMFIKVFHYPFLAWVSLIHDTAFLVTIFQRCDDTCTHDRIKETDKIKEGF